jgi:hypothetical protein
LVPQVIAQHPELSSQEQIFLVKRLLSPYAKISPTMQFIVARMQFNQVVALQDKAEWIQSKNAITPLLQTIALSLAAPMQDGRTIFHHVCCRNLFFRIS